MFRQNHERWIEELDIHLSRDGAITSSGAVLTLPASVQDLRSWIKDTRQFRQVQFKDWQRVVSDFTASIANSGPRLLDALKPIPDEILRLLDQLFRSTTAPDLATIDHAVRAAIGHRLEALQNTLCAPHVSTACFRDLIDTSQNIARPADEIALRRDTLWALCEARQLRLDRPTSVFSTLSSILVDNPDAVHQEMALATGTEHQPRPLTFEPTGINLAERLDLCDQALSRSPDRGDCIVWLRIEPAALPRYEVTHGQITFYNASYLASAVRDPEQSDDLFNVVPTEVLRPTDDGLILRDDEVLWEDNWNMVYVRIQLGISEIHSASKSARALVGALTAVNHPTPQTWKLLDGHLLFIDGSCASLFGWGPKEHGPDDIYRPQSDWMDRRIELMSRHGRSLNSQSMDDLRDALSMSEALKAASTESPQAVVMTAVRAIEHVNVWATGGGKDWAEFARKYFKRGHSRVEFVNQIARIMQAATYIGQHPSHDLETRRHMHDIENALSGYLDSGHKMGLLHDQVTDSVTRPDWPVWS